MAASSWRRVSDCFSRNDRPVLLLDRVIRSKKLFVQQTLGSNDPVLKTILKRRVLSPIIDVFRNRGTNNFGDGLVFDGRNCRQRLSLLGRQPNSHGFGWLHEV